MTDWPFEQAETLQNLASFLQTDLERMDILGALRCISTMQERMSEAAIALIEIAAEETKITQKALANALGVPSSSLRGLRR